MAQFFRFGLQIAQTTDDTFYCCLCCTVHVHFYPAGICQANVVTGLEVTHGSRKVGSLVTLFKLLAARAMTSAFSPVVSPVMPRKPRMILSYAVGLTLARS